MGDSGREGSQRPHLLGLQEFLIGGFQLAGSERYDALNLRITSSEAKMAIDGQSRQ